MLDKYQTAEFCDNISNYQALYKFIKRYVYLPKLIDIVFLQNLIISQIVSVASSTKLSIQ